MRKSRRIARERRSGKVAKKKVPANVSDIVDEIELPNGAQVQRTAFACEVCVERNEEPSTSEFIVEYEGQQLQICRAHMQEVLNSAEDYREGGILEEAFSIPKV